MRKFITHRVLGLGALAMLVAPLAADGQAGQAYEAVFPGLHYRWNGELEYLVARGSSFYRVKYVPLTTPASAPAIQTERRADR